MINFNDPAVLMNGGQRIPIDTQEKYNAVLQAVQSVFGSDFDQDALSQMEMRIRGGQDSNAIVQHAREDHQSRFLLSTNSRTVDSQSAQGNALYGSGSGNASNTPGAPAIRGLSPDTYNPASYVPPSVSGPMDFASVGAAGFAGSAPYAGPVGLNSGRINVGAPGAPAYTYQAAPSFLDSIDPLMIAIIGAVGVGLFFLLRK